MAILVGVPPGPGHYQTNAGLLSNETSGKTILLWGMSSSFIVFGCYETAWTQFLVVMKQYELNSVFAAFNESLFMTSQSEILINSRFIIVNTWFISLWLQWINEQSGLISVISSAYNTKSIYCSQCEYHSCDELKGTYSTLWNSRFYFSYRWWSIIVLDMMCMFGQTTLKTV